MDIEKVGSLNHGAWDLAARLTALPEANGILLFDHNGVDGAGIGPTPWDLATSNPDTIDAAGVNRGKVVLTYADSYMDFSFTNDDGEVLNAALLGSKWLVGGRGRRSGSRWRS